jgi:hypothetical protein
MRAQIHTDTQVGENDRPPASGIMIADMLTGAYAFGAIQTALLGRVSSGLGDHIGVFQRVHDLPLRLKRSSKTRFNHV